MITLCVPYYEQPQMLARHVEEWRRYPNGIKVVVVDDGSVDHPAVEVLYPDQPPNVSLYAIKKDIPWNRNGARNLASHVAETEWLLHTDMDHVLTAGAADALVHQELDPRRWYHFLRYRVGRADETRRKDDLPDDAGYGKVKPHVDSFLMTRDAYWKQVGGYDEDFSGSIGGSSVFLCRAKRLLGAPGVLSVALNVFTRDAVPDASESRLSRDRSRYERIRAEKRAQGDPAPTSHLRFDWEHVL